LKNDEIFSKTVPAKLQTYMALGKPIIAVLNGEGAKLIIESNCGLLEKNYDYEKLAININAFANKREAELIHYGDNAKDYYQKYFNSLKRKEEILNLLYE
jgi:glycosyltransferase involved in cell wall biosynthesis